MDNSQEFSMNEIFFESLDTPIDRPNFHQRVFSLVLQEENRRRVAPQSQEEMICLEEYDFLSQQMDLSRVQESCSARNVLRTRALAMVLIDDQGEIDFDRVQRTIDFLRKHLYSLGPDRHFDSKRQELILQSLLLLSSNKDLQRLLKQITKPANNRHLDQVIRDTLALPPAAILSDGDARRAALAALLCTLRQNVGSCFATAPSILIHDEQPHLFLKDIAELIFTGRLKKTYEGMEYSVPLSISWGAGDLRKPFVLQRAEEPAQLSLAPGIVAALAAAGVVDGDGEQQRRESQQIVWDWMQREDTSARYYVPTFAEELLKQLILQSCNLTKTELEDYEKRPKAHGIGMMLLQPAASSEKTQVFTQFYERFNTAIMAFKALADNALLKSWEFTLASFSEAKSQFSTWNLYSSLGFQPQEPSGIGEAIYNFLKRKLDEANRQLEDLQYDYEQALNHIRYIETRLRTATNEQDAEYLKMEYRSHLTEFQTLEEMRNRCHARAQRYGSLLNLLVDLYSGLFPDYFQEVYDADMHEITANPYDDSPAGFRLIYKAGRSVTSQWLRISTPEEFIEALTSFFVAVEPTIAGEPELEGIEDEIGEITSAIISQIRTQEFLETAFDRMARAHRVSPIKNPLQNLDKISVKPWAYTSGGLMNTFVCSYWKRDIKPTESGRWVENTMELLVFLADCMKQEPKNIADEYLKNPNKSMLIHSPTHAFLFKPGLSPFKETWANDEFTYTSVRDKMIAPMERFSENIILDQAMAYFLGEKLKSKIAPDYRYYFGQVLSYFPGGMNPREFRDYVVGLISQEPALRSGRREILPAEEIDSMLFSLLPLCPDRLLYERIEAILKELPDVEPSMLARFEKFWNDMPIAMRADPMVTAETLQSATKGILCMLFGKTTFPRDYHKLISQAAQKLGFAMPMPLLFADTNWVHDEFGFVVNPGTAQCELWRFDPIGNKGAPMSVWGEWLNGSRKDLTWGVYIRPYEYVL